MSAKEIYDERIENLKLLYSSHGYYILNAFLSIDLLYKTLLKHKGIWDIFFILLFANSYVLIRNILAGTYIYPSNKLPIKSIISEAFIFSLFIASGVIYINGGLTSSIIAIRVVLLTLFCFAAWLFCRIIIIKVSNKKNFIE